MSLILHVLSFLLLSHYETEVSCQDAGPTVRIPQGEIIGTTLKTSSRVEYSAFRGIPYAKAERFKDPDVPDSWNSPLYATDFGPVCPQLDSQGKRIGEEDCLFINVYTPFVPSGSQTRTLYPVMVFIHGGNFQRGSSNPYMSQGFIEKGSVVLVTFNYRLGILGFLSTGDKACPGNFGLKDQVMALKWVRNNINSFGGDPNLITLFGHDAGAASVMLHILSPQSQGLFSRAITQSGSPICDWTVAENPYEYALEIARRLRCTTKSTSAMVDCLARVDSLDNLLKAQKENKTFGDYPLQAVPVVEKNKDGFLPDTPLNLLLSGSFKNVPLLSGVTKDDGSFFYSLIKSYGENLKKNSTFLLSQLIPMFLLTATDIRSNIESVSQVLFFEYFNGIDPTNVDQVLQPFINMTTDAMFVSCNHKTLQLYSATMAPVYMYTFEYKGQYSMLDLKENSGIAYSGVSHGDELLYLFDFPEAELNFPDDKLMSTQLFYLWRTFAQTGKSPDKITLEYPEWEPYTEEFKKYYMIDKKISRETAYRQRAVDLWLNHLPALANITPPVNQEEKVRTGSLGWTMLAIAIILLIVVAVLAVILFRQRKSQYLQTDTEMK